MKTKLDIIEIQAVVKTVLDYHLTPSTDGRWIGLHGHDTLDAAAEAIAYALQGYTEFI